ncbi:hypothetical protein [Pseudofrankia sp. BMG5.36]|uniref:hypothetical protein n=1 Tax=Pseudofrankia sp. BMG5.36 TaxID=1834512 RepID=UPI0008D9DC25|nr:hypothetical protein [Pseudofrankia sp. BMG5.36]OHV57988.1 hypothetical protein BCD48_42695 [Pseudofrankia sp. BMG5.36]
MAEPLTYGGLVEAACRDLATAVVQQPPGIADGAAEDAAALVDLLALAGRHAQFLGQAAGARNPALTLARHLSEAVTATRPILPTASAARGDRWRPAALRLGVAHDLLAAQIGPAGERRGPDAAMLRDRAMIATAAGRLAGLVVLAADSAMTSADHLRRHILDAATPAHPTSSNDPPGLDGQGARAALTVAQALDRVGQVRDAAARLEHAPTRTPGPTALDEITPLLGDETGHPFEQAVERMRYAAHTMTWPQLRMHGAALRTVAELAVTVTSWTTKLAGWAQRHSRQPAQDAYARATTQARRATLQWQNIQEILGPLRTLGLDGRHVDEQVRRLARQIDTGPRAAATPAALLAARRAVLLLPELAAASSIATHHLAGDGLLRVATVTGIWVEPPARVGELTGAYRAAASASRNLVDACAALPGPQPTPGRARYQPDLDTPVLTGQRRAPRPRRPAPPPRDQLISIQDPHHGQLTCDTDLFERALRFPDPNLWDMLRPHTTRLQLTGTESRTTLAALAAIHAPQFFAPSPRATTEPAATENQPDGPSQDPGDTPPPQADSLDL